MEKTIGDKIIKILIIEDEKTESKMLNDFFLRKKYITETISREMNIIEKLEKDIFDIIILCLELYCTEAYKIIKSIRNSKKNYGEIPILALASSSKEEYLYYCKGVSEVVCKPFTVDNIEEKVGKFINPFNKTANIYLTSLTTLTEKLKLTEKNARDFLDEYIKMFQEIILQIKDDCKKGNYEAIRKKAHQIKGVSAVLRIYSVQKISYEIEKKYQEKELCGSISKLETILIQLEKERNMFKEI